MTNILNMKKGYSETTDLKDVTVTASELNTLDGITASVAELNALTNAPLGATITVGADAGTTVAITIQLTDADGNDLATRATLYAFLSDDANGDSIAGTAPDGGVAAGSDGFIDVITTGKSFYISSEADGDIDLVVTESGADVWYLVIVFPNGLRTVSDAITFTA